MAARKLHDACCSQTRVLLTLPFTDHLTEHTQRAYHTHRVFVFIGRMTSFMTTRTSSLLSVNTVYTVQRAGHKDKRTANELDLQYVPESSGTIIRDSRGRRGQKEQ